MNSCWSRSVQTPVVDGIIACLFPGFHGKVHHLVTVRPLFNTRLIGIIVPVLGRFRRLDATLDLFIAGLNVEVQENGVQDELDVIVLHKRLDDVIVRRSCRRSLRLWQRRGGGQQNGRPWRPPCQIVSTGAAREPHPVRRSSIKNKVCFGP